LRQDLCIRRLACAKVAEERGAYESQSESLADHTLAEAQNVLGMADERWDATEPEQMGVDHEKPL
jgi:hypothetical protein